MVERPHINDKPLKFGKERGGNALNKRVFCLPRKRKRVTCEGIGEF